MEFSCTERTERGYLIESSEVAPVIEERHSSSSVWLQGRVDM